MAARYDPPARQSGLRGIRLYSTALIPAEPSPSIIEDAGLTGDGANLGSAAWSASSSKTAHAVAINADAAQRVGVPSLRGYSVSQLVKDTQPTGHWLHPIASGHGSPGPKS